MSSFFRFLNPFAFTFLMLTPDIFVKFSLVVSPTRACVGWMIPIFKAFNISNFECPPIATTTKSNAYVDLFVFIL